MNLIDVINPLYGFQQDYWSLTEQVFGKEGQIKVIGWGDKAKATKYYIVQCSVCSNDAELFGEGIFRTLKGDLLRGKFPCGCSGQVRQWTEHQAKILCQRKAEELGYGFLGWGTEYQGIQKTKIVLYCEDHGEWRTGRINGLLFDARGCPICKGGVAKSDDTMISSFFNSGQFTEGTKFWKSQKVNRLNCRVYWNVACPDCGYEGESIASDLQRGHRPCLCSKMRQKECYINWVIEGGEAIALKFGIANDSKRRVYQQNSASVYEIRNYAVYIFPDKNSCWDAERECKQTLRCGILTKDQLSNGYTETTDVLNIVRIKSIFEKHGGVRLKENEI